MTRISCSIRCFQMLVMVALLAYLSTSAFANSYSPSPGDLLVNGNIGVTVDENGVGVLNGFGGPEALPVAFQNDPGPGGLNSVMTYDLLSSGTFEGDVLLTENGVVLDVIRFNLDQIGHGPPSFGTLVFYSDNLDGFDSKADTATPPQSFYANTVTLAEVGGKAVYIPHALPSIGGVAEGQPGFVPDAAVPVEYTFISDAQVPEPSTLGLLGFGLLGLTCITGMMRHKSSIGRFQKTTRDAQAGTRSS